MEQRALVTGADRGLGFALTEGLLARGWRVFAGEYLPQWPQLRELQERFPQRLTRVRLDVGDEASTREAARRIGKSVDGLDIVVNNAGVAAPPELQKRRIRDGQDYGRMHREFDVNSLGPLRIVEAFLPLTDRGAMKRLAFVSSEAGSVERSTRTSWFGYCMSKSALNMAVRILFNDLRPEGYTFRVYHPGWMKSYMSGRKNAEADMEPEAAAVPALEYFLGDRPAGSGGRGPVIDEDRLVLRDNEGREWPW
jgi:NAD(P)-dependent dehydrogenase (short-subunit alcohol dehydrogenase family)